MWIVAHTEKASAVNTDQCWRLLVDCLVAGAPLKWSVVAEVQGEAFCLANYPTQSDAERVLGHVLGSMAKGVALFIMPLDAHSILPDSPALSS